MRAYFVLSLFIVAACGGKSFTNDFDGGDGSAGDGSAGGDGSSGGEGGTTVDGGTSDSGRNDGGTTVEAGQSCTKLQQELDALRIAARRCCPLCSAIQCDHVAHDLCCPISYSLQSQMAVDEFAKKVSEYEASCGPIACPATPCRVAPSLNCDPNTSLCQ